MNAKIVMNIDFGTWGRSFCVAADAARKKNERGDYHVMLRGIGRKRP